MLKMENCFDKRILTSSQSFDVSHKKEEKVINTACTKEFSAPSVEGVHIGNSTFFLPEIKQEPRDLLLATSQEIIITNTPHIKMEPEWNRSTKKQFSADTFLYKQATLEPTVIVKLESPLIEEKEYLLDQSDETSGTALNIYETFYPKPIEVIPVKTEITESIQEIENTEFFFEGEDFEGKRGLSPKIEKTVITDTDEQEIKEMCEIVFDEWKTKNEEVDLKQEDIEQNHAIMSSSGFRPGKCDASNYNYCKTVDNLNFRTHLFQHKDLQRVADERNLKERNSGQKYPKHGNLFKCKQCEYQTIYKGDLNRHLLRHKDLSEVHTFNCNECNYKALKRGHLNRHQLRHKDPKELNMFSCDKCDFKTRYKESLNGHMIRHKNIDEVKTFNCNHCNYITIAKSSLTRHQLRHEDVEKVNFLKCDQCEYKTIDKSYLNRHLLRHKDGCILKCSECDYQTTDKTYLRKHQRRHRDRKDIDMFGCFSCDFKTHNKDNLKTHLLRHQNREELNAYKCSHCEYKTLLKGDLNRHQLRHRDPDEMDIFSCEICDFKTAHKKSLKRHMLRHEDIEKLHTFKCNQCDYQTIQKAHLKRHQLRHEKPVRLKEMKEANFKIIKTGEINSRMRIEFI